MLSPAKISKLIIMLRLVTRKHDPALRIRTVLNTPPLHIMRNRQVISRVDNIHPVSSVGIRWIKKHPNRTSTIPHP
jgi:hypothetical protein